MIRLKYILMMTLLAITTLVFAQDPYVIDSVCVGADRTYRLDGENGSTYEWNIRDSDSVLFASPFYVDFRLDDDPNPGDTIWGSEIDQLWDVVGEFDIVVLHWSLHGCDTVEMGRVKVFPTPEAEAGPDRVICSLEDIVVSNDTAWNYSSFYWETTGDGTFSTNNQLHPTYYLGANDSLTGSITLVLTAFGLADNETCIPAVDSITFLFSKPEISFTVQELLCYNDRDAYIQATVTVGQPPYTYEWTGPPGFVSNNIDEITGLWAGTYVLKVTDDNDCIDIDSVEIVNPPELTIDNITVSEISCYGYSDGAITASASGGTGSLTFQWRGALGSTYSGNAITGLPADTYFLAVYDENICTVRDTIVLENPELLLVNVTADDTILCEGEVLTLHGNPLGGTGELDHRWTGTGSIYLETRYDSVVVFMSHAPIGTHNLIYTIRDEAGCEASDSIELNVYPPSYSYDSMEICMGDAPFFWNNRTILSDADRIYRDTLVGLNQYGCDSLLTLEVDVLFPELYATTIYECENEEPYAPYGNITIFPDRDSIYLDTLYYTDSGCDSLLITINVFTLPVTDTLLDTTLCVGADEFVWNNVTILTEYDSIYLDTMVNSFGCDSLLTYDVKVIPPDTTYVFDTLCQDEPVFVWNEITIQTVFDSIYEATLPNRFGCDSIVNLNMTIVPSTDTLIDTMLCYGTPQYAWNNLVILSDYDSIYLDTLVNAAGCDSLLTLDVTVMYPDTVNIDTTLCEGVAPFAWNSNTVFALQDSIYRDTLQNQYGCDSLVSLDVRILLPYDSTEVREICENDLPFTWGSGQTILPDRDSIYLDTLYYAAGCDSLRLQLEIITLPVSDTLIDTVLCEGSPEFVWNSHTISTFVDSTYLDTLENQWLCDSTITFVVDIVPAFKDTFPEPICYGEPLADWYGQSISSTIDSTYVQLLPDPLGCDTLLFYEVTVLPVTDTILDTTLCAGLPEFMWNNRLISTTRDSVYLDTLVNSYTCDSLLTYNVTIIPPDTTLVYDTLCVGDPEYDWNGQMVSTTVEAEYIATVPNAVGCDSVVILGVTLINGITIYDTVYACEEYTWTDGTGLTYTVSDDYLHTIDGGAACADSTWLHLVVSPPLDLVADPVDVLCYGDSTGSIDLSIQGGIEPFTVLWNTGDTTESLNNLPAGTYSVWVSDSLECADSLVVVISEPPQLQITLDNITDVVIPGQSTGSIEVSVTGGFGDYTYQWTDQSGTVIANTEDLLDQRGGEYTIEVVDENDCTVSLTATIFEPTLKYLICPPDLTLACFEDLGNYPNAATLNEFLLLDTLVDVYSECGIDSASFKLDSVVVGSAFCYEELRYYSVIDSCGDTLSCFHAVIVNDIEVPVLTCPPTIVVTNNLVPPAYADTSEFLAAGGLFDDNCDVVSFGLVSEVTDGGTDTTVTTRTYEVSDYCGNVASCTQRIEVYLSAPFVIECEGLPSANFECVGQLPKYTNIDDFRDAGGYAYSSPFAITDFKVTDDINGNRCPEIVIYTYTIINSNGESVSCDQRFEVNDETAPTLILPDKHIYCNESWPIYGSYVDVLQFRSSHGNDAFDNCGNSSIRAVSLFSYDEVGSCPTKQIRVYRITDWCNNSSFGTEEVYVYDTIAPVIVSTPKDIETDCFMPEPYADYAEFVDAGGWVTDDCGLFYMAYMGDSVAGTSEPGLVYRTYRFIDECDNYSDYVQKVTVLDSIPPTIGIPDLTLDCEPVEIVTIEEFIDFDGWFDDNCEIDSSSFKLISSITFDSVCPRTYVNTYEIYDMSGNRGETDHTITVVDTIPPLLVCPPDDTIDVTEAFPPPFARLDGFITGGGITDDNCAVDSSTFTLVSADSVISDCESQITYTYIIADECGNWSETCSYTIYKRDQSDPVLTCPGDITVECFDDVDAQIFTSLDEFITAGGSATDNYDLLESTFRHVGDSLIGTNCPLIIVRTYSIEDICGNSATCSYRITVNDVTPPEITCPADTAIECLSNVIHNITTIAEFEAAGGELSDNCEIDPNSFTARTEKVYALASTTIISHFSISDLCGNIDSCVQVITLTDTIPPVPVCNEITVYLDDEGNYLFTEIDIDYITAGASDNCTAEEDLIIDVEIVDVTCLDVEDGKLINVVVTDEAGNSAECMAQINVVDDLPPVAICQDITVYLDENGQVSITAGMLDNGSFDNCELESIVISKDQFDCTDVGENIVELIATDVYGNRDTCEATVTVYDKIPPYITCIGKTTIQLDENATYFLTWQMVTDSVSDNCAVDTVLLSKYMLDCDDIGTTFITAIAYDVNGNVDSCIAEFEVFGNVPPNALNDTAVTAVNVAVDINVVNNDYDLKTDIDYSTLGITIGPSHGSVVVDTVTGIVSYTPDLDYQGPDIFFYSICDDAIPCEPMCDEAIVFIVVRPANQPPVAVDDYYDVPCGNLFGNVLLNDSDPDGDEISVLQDLLSFPTNGMVTQWYSDGTFEYEPFSDFNEGIDSFQYIIRDYSVVPVTPLYDTAWVYITRVADNDCDGVADIDDIDDDNDGIRDIHEGDGAYDSDNDGIPDSYDIDSDNDGIPDNIEGQDEDNYINPEGWRDENGNGWDDRYDHEEGGYPFDIALTDTDGDGIPDFLDIDSDGDGVFDYIEGHDENADGIADVIPMYADTDYDGLDDAYDTHPGWGLTDNETGSSAPIQDFDSDGVRDWRDTNDEDDEHMTEVEDLNGNGDYSDDDLDLDGHPEYLDTEMDCELFIPDGFSPNDDGVHDFFQILCIYPRYPDAKLMIFNRQGQKLFEKENYGNYDVWGWDDAWWWGTTENRFTIGRSGGLPAGNYVYVLELGNGEVENGTVMVAY